MKKISKSHHSSLNELNITPLLDLAFVLLVIFIITTPQLSNDLEMNLPSARKQAPPAKPPSIHYLNVDEAGNVTVDRTAMTVAQLRQTLTEMKTAEDPSVVVRGAANADYQKVITVLDVLQQLDITKVGLATETAP